MTVHTRGFERCKGCASRKPIDAKGWTEIDGRPVCPRCNGTNRQAVNIYDLSMYVVAPTHYEFIRRDDLILYAQGRSPAMVHRAKAQAKERAHGWQLSAQRMDTPNRSSGYLYFRPDEPALRMIRLVDANGALAAATGRDPMPHERAPVMRLLIDETGDVGWRIDSVRGTWLRVNGKWTLEPVPWTWSTEAKDGRVWRVCDEI